MKKLIINCILLMIGTISCSKSDPIDQAGIEKEKAADAVLHKVAAQMKKEVGLRPVGTMGQMHYDVEVLGLSFYYYKPTDITEGRKLLVQAVNAMLEEINQDQKIRPYLCRHPFAATNVEMDIFLHEQDGRDVPRGTLCGIDASEGFLKYRIHHPETGRLITIYKETFDEALQRLADPSLPLVPFASDPEINAEEMARLRKGISFVDSSGSIFHLDESGRWAK